MASRSEESRSRPTNRFRSLALGIVLGFAWGTIMWALTTAFGQDTGGVKGWLYLAISMAMIGGGVAAVFGAFGAKKRGERLGPRIRRR